MDTMGGSRQGDVNFRSQSIEGHTWYVSTMRHRGISSERVAAAGHRFIQHSPLSFFLSLLPQDTRSEGAEGVHARELELGLDRHYDGEWMNRFGQRDIGLHIDNNTLGRSRDHYIVKENEDLEPPSTHQ
jgi:hypothetical protein